MAYPWDVRIWGRNLNAAQRTINNLIRTISSYERVSLLVPPAAEKALAREFRSSDVEFVPAAYNDIWVRDTLPTFAIGIDGSLIAINWHFNGWGKARGIPVRDDLKIGRAIARILNATVIDTDVVSEGGAFAFDGHRLVVATQSVMLDRRRNRDWKQAYLQDALLRAAQCTSICWLPGDDGEPISRGHADAILAFAKPNIVLIDWAAEEYCLERQLCELNLFAFKSWAGRAQRDHEIVKMPSLPRDKHYCASYINFIHVNGALIVPKHGGRASRFDSRAKAILEEIFGKPALLVPITLIADYGGGIHCVTQQEPNPVGISPR